MSIILDIRGTNGSGKSWVAHRLIKSNKTSEIRVKGKLVGYSIPKYDLGVVGPYNRTCGGCDALKSADEIENQVRWFSTLYGKVVFESLMASHTYERYNKLALSLGEEEYYFMFLNTPVSECVARVRARRLKAGNEKPFDPDKKMGLTSDYERVLSAYRKLKADGRNIIDLNWMDPMPQVMKLLRS